jgi:hypothetical protein
MVVLSAMLVLRVAYRILGSTVALVVLAVVLLVLMPEAVAEAVLAALQESANPVTTEIRGAAVVAVVVGEPRTALLVVRVAHRIKALLSLTTLHSCHLRVVVISQC